MSDTHVAYKYLIGWAAEIMVVARNLGADLVRMY